VISVKREYEKPTLVVHGSMATHTQDGINDCVIINTFVPNPSGGCVYNGYDD